jgi:hypothetical protein
LFAASEPKGDRRVQQLKPSRAMNPERPAACQAPIEAPDRDDLTRAVGFAPARA